MKKNNNCLKVPVVDVTSDNLLQLQPRIYQDLESADFVAIDCELSGLGQRKKLSASNIDERYENAGAVAKTRSIIALGLSLFSKATNSKSKIKSADPVEEEEEEEPNHQALSSYTVVTYNIFVLCNQDYIVEPGSLKFLVEHGFDFTRQYSKGVPYYRGDDKPVLKKDKEEEHLRDLFAEIVRFKKKVVLHNGFIDLVFLYQNLYARLPVSLQTFVADLSEMFPNGLYDTKYISDYIYRTPSSFLEFVFKQALKTNEQRCQKNLSFISLVFRTYSAQDASVEYRTCTLKPDKRDKHLAVCDDFANHGHCKQGKMCEKSHDIMRIIEDKMGGSKAKKRKDSIDCQSTDDSVIGNGDVSDEVENSLPNSKPATPQASSASAGNGSGGHRAGFDAFMTGYTFAAYLTHNKDNKASSLESEVKNKVYLMSKSFPLSVQKSVFAKISASHANKSKSMTVNSEDL